jgi:hypothetical protein
MPRSSHTPWSDHPDSIWWKVQIMKLLFLWFSRLHDWMFKNESNSMEHSPSWEANTQLDKFPAIYGTRKFITVLTKACHWSPTWSRWIQTIPSNSIFLISFLILTSILCLVLPRGLYLSGFPTKILYEFLVSPIRSTFSAHRILLLISLIIFGAAYTFMIECKITEHWTHLNVSLNGIFMASFSDVPMA